MITAALAPLLKPGVTYDDATALHLAQHAAAVYQPGDAYWQACIEGGYDQAVTAISGATQTGIAISKRLGLMVLTDRGSNEDMDWLENLMCWKVRWPEFLPPEAQVHAGFLTHGLRATANIVTKVKAACRYLGMAPCGLPLFVTAHSLGGPGGSLVALALERELGMRIVAVYTFQSPRIGNRAFAEWWDRHYGQITHRVVRFSGEVSDLVARLPPSCRPFSYWHCGRPSLISNGIRFESREAWDKHVRENRLPVLARWRLISRLKRGVQAHAMGDVVKELAAMHERRMEAKWAPIEALP